mgnify:CR=1 FL=1
MMKPTYNTTAEILSIYREQSEALSDHTNAIKPQYKTTTQVLATFPRQVAAYSSDTPNS